MYNRHLRTEEAFTILREMKRFGYEPTLNSYKELLSTCGRLHLWEETENRFKDMEMSSRKLDRSTYHIMIKAYRRAGEYKKSRKSFS